METTRKYRLTEETITINNVTLHRIEYLRAIGDYVEAGDYGGYVESEKNLSHEGECLILHEAKVYGDAVVKDDAQVYDDAEVYGYAIVSGDEIVCGDEKVDNQVSK